jgi:integrase
MAAVQERNGHFRIIFRAFGKQHSLNLGAVSAQEADSKRAQVDYLLMRLKQGLLTLPPGVDLVEFVQHDGQPPERTRSVESPKKVIYISNLQEGYLATHSNGTLESNTLATCRIHFQHLLRQLGTSFPLHELTLATLQKYVNDRSKQSVRAVTIRKELATLRGAWNWGRLHQLTSGSFPNQGLRFPKSDENHSFMTRDEIERRIQSGEDPEKLWDCLYLQADELTELLVHIQEHAIHDWIYPLVCFAAHTGARRSELIRVLLSDLDFNANVVEIREKKRGRGKRTSRRVPLTPFLRQVLQDWLQVHPGGNNLFCHSGTIARSRKRSQTTGHTGTKGRPTTTKARLANVKKRQSLPPSELTPDEVHHHWKQTLKGSRWEVLRGLHALRHSFVSACASQGIDQRLVESWAGHMSAEMSRRYAHLWPSLQQDAIKKVFKVD